MSSEKRVSLKTSHWVWNDLINELVFLSRDAKEKEAMPQRLVSCMDTDSLTSQGPSRIIASKDVHFKQTVGNLSQMRFRRFYQRKVRLFEPEVITLQDVKDVAIFTCNVTLLTPEFISYFHSQTMDNFLRSLILYFQFYFQIWNKMQLRRDEATRKLRQPIVTELENTVRDDLADLRGMVARDYAVILMGIGDAKRFHHMNNKNNDSFSDRDRRLFECLMMMTIRVIWIALSRKYNTLIEKELNRMLRTNIFSPSVHSAIKHHKFDTYPQEDRILIGKAYTVERKLLHRSPTVQELICDNHDYRMLAIGVTDTGCNDARQSYLEAAYTAPEELLWDMKIPVGILGIPRKYYDTMLKFREISTRKKLSTMRPIPEFILPPKVPYKTMGISKTLDVKACKYTETKSTKATRKRQCKIWRKYVEEGGAPPPTTIDLMASLTPSLTALRASIAPVYSKYN